jgi:hypothetical protein
MDRGDDSREPQSRSFSPPYCSRLTSTRREASWWENSRAAESSQRPPSPRPLGARGAPQGRPQGARTGAGVQKRTKNSLRIGLRSWKLNLHRVEMGVF